MLLKGALSEAVAVNSVLPVPDLGGAVLVNDPEELGDADSDDGLEEAEGAVELGDVGPEYSPLRGPLVFENDPLGALHGPPDASVPLEPPVTEGVPKISLTPEVIAEPADALTVGVTIDPVTEVSIEPLIDTLEVLLPEEYSPLLGTLVFVNVPVEVEDGPPEAIVPVEPPVPIGVPEIIVISLSCEDGPPEMIVPLEPPVPISVPETIVTSLA